MADERKLRLTTLRDELLEYIKTSRDYKTDIREVKWGPAGFEQMISRPAICFWCENDEGTGEFADHDHRFLHIVLWAYADSDGYGNAEIVYNIANDVEYFLQNDFTYNDWVFMGDFKFYEGGVQDPACGFMLTFRIRYENTTNTR